MSRFLESIAVKERSFLHLSWHNARFQTTQRERLGMECPLRLGKEISIPADLGQDLYKCRIVYDTEIRDISFQPYTPKSIKRLALISANDIDYDFKSEDRSQLTHLYQQRGVCDDILIVKNGYLTDTYYCNVAAWDGEKWLTPHQPLLTGTCRARLLTEGKIQEAEIRPKDLKHFSHLRLINAMLGWEKSNDVSCRDIYSNPISPNA